MQHAGAADNKHVSAIIKKNVAPGSGGGVSYFIVFGFFDPVRAMAQCAQWPATQTWPRVVFFQWPVTQRPLGFFTQ